MKIDTGTLGIRIERLNNCLDDYYPEVEAMSDKFDKISLEIEKIMDETLEKDKSRIMRMLYKQKVDELKDVIEITRTYLSNVKLTAEDLSFDVEDNWKELMNEE